MNIEIKSFIRNSLLDWEGKIVSTVYIGGCNFRCPFCHNRELVLSPENLKTIETEEVLNYLNKNKIFVDGVCVTGGEPCLNEDLPEFLKQFKSTGMLVKLDTNGSYPERLKKIIDAGLVDYIAMDIKSSLEEVPYLKSCGIINTAILPEVKKSIELIMSCGIDYEFRTTVVPLLHTKEEILQIAKAVSGAKKLAIQNFSNHETLDPEFKTIKPYSLEELEKLSEGIKVYVQKCVIRGGF
ncbi:MAG: anaerobic ribonucleoside-triphosphate reductase activating protein [Candidatus Omnitrophota bacterium]